jgi:hypothetical protein
MKDRICPPYQGCKGSGSHADSCDSGSGREVYCDCPAGVRLREQDAQTFYPPPTEPTDGWERVAEGVLEECAPGIYIAGAKEMDPTTRTDLLYALGGPPWASRSAREAR